MDSFTSFLNASFFSFSSSSLLDDPLMDDIEPEMDLIEPDMLCRESEALLTESEDLLIESTDLLGKSIRKHPDSTREMENNNAFFIKDLPCVFLKDN